MRSRTCWSAIAATPPRWKSRSPARACGSNAPRASPCAAPTSMRAAMAAPIPGWRPMRSAGRRELALGACRRGARAYLAVAGGFAVSAGARQRQHRSARRLRRHRRTRAGRAATSCTSDDGDHRRRGLRSRPWWIDPAPDLDFDSPAIVRVLPGQRCDRRPPDAVFAREWRVAAASNRQGLRLEGDIAAAGDAGERISEPVAPGTVQLPPDGQPDRAAGRCADTRRLSAHRPRDRRRPATTGAAATGRCAAFRAMHARQARRMRGANNASGWRGSRWRSPARLRRLTHAD